MHENIRLRQQPGVSGSDRAVLTGGLGKHQLGPCRGGQDADRLGPPDVLGVGVAPIPEDVGDPVDHGIEEDRISGVDPGRHVGDVRVIGREFPHEPGVTGLLSQDGDLLRGDLGDQPARRLQHPPPRQCGHLRCQPLVQNLRLLHGEVEPRHLGSQLTGPPHRDQALRGLEPQQRMAGLQVHHVTDQPGGRRHRNALRCGHLQRQELIHQDGAISTDPHRTCTDHVNGGVRCPLVSLRQFGDRDSLFNLCALPGLDGGAQPRGRGDQRIVHVFSFRTAL
ncbi:hypothetical protein [Propionicimonas sp.]|uniref:hypothetical protein n=1 Tax=Propionicimonas sp. TaxID=1955623 RepID=UPI0039C93C0F